MDLSLTIGDAAARLGVSRQRISQMLGDGHLEGPPQRRGSRAPRNALRVFVTSVEAMEESRAQPKPSRRSPHSSVSAAALKDDAYRMKVALDVARDGLAQQRRQNQRLTALLADVVSALEEEQVMAKEAERITEEYAAIATNHLGPDTGNVL